jgi:cobalt-zinc-cadmium efflux system membrane fusion protein
MSPGILLSSGLFILCLLLIGRVGLAEDDHKHEHKHIDDTTEVSHDESPVDLHEGHDHDGTDEDADHEGHDHEAEAEDGHDNDAEAEDGHDHDAEAEDGHNDEDHGEEGLISLSSEAVNMAGITTSHVERGSIAQSIELPGEIGFNEDRLIHITPRFAGIARKANYRVGDYVEAGNVLAVIESNESLTAYNIKAPISGWIISRHISTGEFVGQENSIYILADLSTVWANLAVYAKDADYVKPGMEIEITAVGSEQQAHGIISYVSPVLDINTRSLTARVILANNGNTWRPGTFVRAHITTDHGYEGLLVKKNAVQVLDGESVVFVLKGENRYQPVPVKTGDYDVENIIIISGLEADTEYVSQGAFELKAKIVTSNLDAHAGHGH